MSGPRSAPAFRCEACGFDVAADEDGRRFCFECGAEAPENLPGDAHSPRPDARVTGKPDGGRRPPHPLLLLVALVPMAGVGLVMAVTLSDGSWPRGWDGWRTGGALALTGSVATLYVSLAYVRQAKRKPGRGAWRLLARLLALGSIALLALVLLGLYLSFQMQVV